VSTIPEPTPSPAPAPPPAGRVSALRVLALLLVPVLIFGGVVGFFYFSEFRTVTPVDFAKSIRAGVSNPEKLDASFTDADGDLVADPPKDPAKQVDPDTLTFSTLERDVEKARAEWKEFVAFLEKTTGKKVELVAAPQGGQGTVEQMNEGNLHIATLSTGAVPLAVNKAGFVPCCVMADENGNYAYQMKILVRADGPIKTPAGLKGKTLTLTSMSSLSSFKAPVVVLWKDYGLRPDVDYKVQIAGGQGPAIRELAEGEIEATAVASDYMSRVLRDEKISPKTFRTIYESESYPPACFGYVYNLKPELAKKVRDAFLKFKWQGTALEQAYRPANQVRFKEVNYKKDWESVRGVDRAILDLVGKGS
jgi:phosphonate transport system substrate-binding protein